ncbi:MAG TPA: FAD-dependent oxidoreductase [Solirubrobacteraceae bacterium]|nr:FAD-dependent oxidoreductase [Solirubrobacteraceae bacterium]
MTTHTHGRRLSDDGIVIAGGGLTGQRCAETLRRNGYTGALRLVCAERHLPYDRPPLSKAALLDDADARGLAYRAGPWYQRQSVDVLLGVRATALDADRRTVALSDGHALRYRRLLIATGGRPRPLPLLSGYDNVSVLRTLEDAARLRSVLAAGRRLAIIGAGFIGLEIAATARRRGVAVTIIEAANCPLEGVLGTRLGSWFARLHRDEGVDVRTGVTVESALGARSVRSLRLSTGAVVETDHVVVGVGSAADVDWLRDSPLGTPAGVTVDAQGRTGLPDVFAAGDAAATFDPVSGRHVAGSHWEAAARDGTRVAQLMLGLDPGPRPLTSFWTDQYGLRIQYVGRRRPGDVLAIDGQPSRRDFTATFLRQGRIVAALLVNRPRQLPAIRQAIEKGTA